MRSTSHKMVLYQRWKRPIGSREQLNSLGSPIESNQFEFLTLLGDNFTSIMLATGNKFSCALSHETAIKCWGELRALSHSLLIWHWMQWQPSTLFSNTYYQLGDGTTGYRGDDSDEMGDNLNDVDLGTSFVPIDIAAGGWHVCAMTQSHAVKCWGKLVHSLYIQYHSVLCQFAGRNDFGQLGIGCEWTEEFGDSLDSLDFGSDWCL